MSIFTVFFFMVFSIFYLFAFSAEAQDGGLDSVEQEAVVLDVCLEEIVKRRVVLQEEMVTVRQKMKEVEDKKKAISQYAGQIHQAMMKAHILDYVMDEWIDLSEQTCNTFLDEAISNPEIQTAVIDNMFHSFVVFTGQMIETHYVERTWENESGGDEELLNKGSPLPVMLQSAKEPDHHIRFR